MAVEPKHVKDMRYPEMSCFLNESESDVLFIIDGQRVPALRHVLGLKSEVFRAMFSGKYKESEEKEIPIEDMNAEAFKVMILYLYTDQLVLSDGTDVELVGDVVKIADKYQLYRLMETIEKHMISIVNVDNLEIISKMAFTYPMKKLRTCVETFIAKNLDQLLAKNAEELAPLNEATNDFCLKTMVASLKAMTITNEKYRNAEQYFKNKIPSNGNIPSYITINGNDLIIQTKTEFLKLKDCIDTDEALEKFPTRRAEFVNDNDMKTFLSKYWFDVYKPVFGFTFQFMSNSCGSLDVLNECTEVYDDSQIFYACLYGSDTNNASLTSITAKYNDSRLMLIMSSALNSRAKTYCESKWKHRESHSSKEGFFSGVSFRLPQPEIESNDTDSGYDNTTAVYPTNGTAWDNGTAISYYDDKITYQVFTAQSMANPDTVDLLGYKFSKSQMFGTNQTLKTLFGCGRYQYDSFPLFKPNDFCGTDQRLESVFGLGNDLYFQNNAKFWKWSDVSFKSGANPNITSEPISFDSDFTSIVSKFNIDTTRPVMGFTFKLYTKSKKCLTNDDTIRCQLFSSPHYYRACIYGEVITNHTIGKLEDTYERKAFAFQYTPSGLNEFPDMDSRPQTFKETQLICDNIHKLFRQQLSLSIQSMRLSVSNSSHIIVEMIGKNSTNDWHQLEVIVSKNRPLDSPKHRVDSIVQTQLGPIDHMIPNNKGSNEMRYPISVHTIGAFDKQYLQNNITSDTILAIAYFQTNQSVDQYRDWFLNPLAIVFDRKEYSNVYNQSRCFAALEFPANSTPFSGISGEVPTDYGRNRFTKILGMFSLNEMLYLLVFPKDISYPVVYQISAYNNINRQTLDGFEFNVFFKCPKPSTSQSTAVFGFTYQYMSNNCGSLDVLNECTEVYDDPQIFYTCLYGTNKTGGSQTWLARKYNNSLLMTINTPVLESRVKTYCGFKWKHNDTNLAKEGFFSGVSFRLPHPESLAVDMNTINTTSSGLPVNPINGTADDNSTRVLVPFYEDKITFQIFTAESLAFPNTVNLLGYQFCKLWDSNLSMSYIYAIKYYLPKDDVYYVFRYLNQTWSCGHNCGPNTPLSLIDLSDNLTTTLTTLRSLFGCESYHYESYPSFKPNDFCGTDQRLESVFGLGNDLYFQNNAKFWKWSDWSDVSFKSGANPGIKSEPIFFDSDFTSILNKFHIDTTKPVMGFTFKLYTSYTSNVSECFTNADTIRCQLYLNPHYYRACIYAEVIDNKTIGKLKDDFEQKAFAFQYTPSGLKAFPAVERPKGRPYQLVSDETQAICDTIRNAFKQKHPLLVHSMRLQSVNASHLIIEMIATNTNNELQLLETVVLRNKPLDETTNYLKHILRNSHMNPTARIQSHR
ncbi:unnamed protein product [Medioppia subpectinata]|uniref:BTB domain-containing protein n=1 Tax=Medioppia subpectinata TaxID=1979941 RepID=A0A7R9KHT7_9ACAR|nr:unnamed protein product [Medioppia subpectinata]CAG2103747.1 unnamed protein product [Medioppia subpectinata]